MMIQFCNLSFAFGSYRLNRGIELTARVPNSVSVTDLWPLASLLQSPSRLRITENYQSSSECAVQYRGPPIQTDNFWFIQCLTYVHGIFRFFPILCTEPCCEVPINWSTPHYGSNREVGPSPPCFQLLSASDSEYVHRKYGFESRDGPSEDCRKAKKRTWVPDWSLVGRKVEPTFHANFIGNRVIYPAPASSAAYFGVHCCTPVYVTLQWGSLYYVVCHCTM